MALYKPLFLLQESFKQVTRWSASVIMVRCGIHISRRFKEELVWAFDKQFRFVNKITFLKQLYHYGTEEKSYFKLLYALPCDPQ